MHTERMNMDDISDIFPLTSTQKGMLYHSLNDGDGMYVETVSLRLHGNICIETFKKAWQAVVDNNDCLRTVFRWEALDMPVQLVMKKVEAVIEVYHHPVELAPVQFDLHQIPFFVRLICLSQSEYVMSIHNHHILFDGWSTNVILDEFFHLYASKVRGDNWIVPKKENEFKRYVLEKKKNLDSFWKEYLQGYGERSFFPKSRTDQSMDHPSKQKPIIYKVIKSTLTDFTEKWGYPVSALSNTCWALMYHKILGTEDIVFGTTVSTRAGAYSDSATGLFINTIPLRLKIRRDTTTILELLEQSVQSANSRLGHERSSLTSIKKCAGLLDDQELFDTIVVVENYPVSNIAGKNYGGLTIQDISSYEKNNYSICLGVDDSGEEIHYTFMHDSREYDISYIENMVSQFETIMNQILTDPKKLVQEVYSMDSREHERIQHLSQNPFYPQKESRTNIIALFDHVVAQHPERIAVKYLDQTMTYRELSACTFSNAATIAMACGTAKIVPVFFEKSLNFIVALLSVLRAGKAFYPIDPADPDIRIQEYLKMLHIDTIVLTEETHIPRLEQKVGLSGNQLLLLRQKSIPQPDGLAGTILSEEDLAYILRTSGTTGDCKFVKISHSNISHYIENYYSVLEINERDIALGIPPISFDAFYEVLFSVLLRGGMFISPKEDDIRDIGRLHKCLLTDQCTIVNCAPQVLGALNKLPLSPYVKYYISGGDVLQYKFIDKLLSQSKVYNIYGPAEATMGSTYYEITDQNVCIGYPFPSHKIYLLDEQLNVVPIGSTGEICIAGPCVSQGYLNNLPLTQEKFIYYHGERMYRSGDKGKWDADGKLHFLGRDDMQVKLRGYRIELIEIDQLLLTHNQITDAVTLPVVNHNTKQLVSYYVSQRPIDHRDLEQFLKKRLPTYMVPSHFIHMKAFEYTKNGKIDKAALPQWQPTLNLSFKTPSNETEHKIRQLWAGLLSRDAKEISVNDNFFELGGDSIISMQFAYKAEDIGLSFHTNDIFEHQTIRELAHNVSDRSEHARNVSEELQEQVLSPIQRQFFSKFEGHHNHWMQSVLFEVTNACTTDSLKQIITKTLTDLKELQIRFRFDGNQWLWHNEADHEIPEIEIIPLQGISAQEQRVEMERTANQLYQIVNIETGPLYCAAIFVEKERPHYLLMAIHHLIIDAYSWRLIAENIECYLQNQKPRPYDHDAYHTWITHQKKWTDSDEGQADYHYWLKYLLENEYRAIKTDLDDGPNIEAASSVLKKEFSQACMQQESAAFDWDGYDLQSTLFSAVLKGLQEKFRTKHLVHVEGHGREGESFGFYGSQVNSIGWYTSIYPLINDIDPAQDFTQIIQGVQNKIKQIPYHGAGYQIAKYMHPAGEKLKLLDQSDILISYLGVLDNQELPSLRLLSTSVGNIHAPAAKRDYLLEIDVYILNKNIHAEVRYSRNHFQQESIYFILDHMEQVLRNDLANRTVQDAKAGQKQSVEYALSPVQESMLFHVMYNETNHVGIEQSILLLKPTCDLGLLEEAWNELINCHDALRAKFIQLDNGSWKQYVDEGLKLSFQYESEDESKTDFMGYLKEVANKEIDKGFSLDIPPLMRFTVVKQKQRQYLIWTYHHLLLDGWCLHLLIEQLNQIYFALGRYTEVQMQTSSLASYSNWICHVDKSSVRNYWVDYFEGFSQKPLLSELLPKTRTAKTGFCEVELKMDRDAETLLKTAAKSAKVTMNTLIQGAWALLLHLYTGESDIIFGVTSAGRPSAVPHIDTLIGCFMNTLPFRVCIDAQQTVSTYLRALQQKYSRMRTYDTTSLSTIIDCANVNRNSGLFDLYDSIVIVENYYLDFSAQGIFEEHVSVYEETGYPITFYCNLFSGLNFKLLYDGALMDDTTARNILKFFQKIILAFTQDLILKEIVDEVSHKNGLTGRLMPASSHQTYMDLFLSNLEEHAANIAASCGDTHLTYRQLNQRFLAFSQEIQKEHPAQNVIPIIVNRSTDMVVAMLAVLKAGYAFTFIDATYPKEYINSILENCGGEYAVVHDQKDEGDNPILKLARTGAGVNGDIQNGVLERPQETDIAYVVYTSGSTGKEKGIIVSNKCVVSHVINMCSRYELTPQDHVLQFSSISFDISLEQIFTTLAAKATLHIRGNDLWTPFDLAREVEKNNLTVMNLPTSFWHQVVNAWIDNQMQPSRSLRLVIAGGEAMSPVVARLWMHSPFKHIKLMNAYGPAETVMTSTLFTVPQSFSATDFTPVGKPLANRNLYVERNGIRVPDNILGEIVFSGHTIASGYWHLNEATEKQFVFKDSYTTYRSGDIGRIVSPGLLEVVGRNDDQVKIRTHRIELNEVQARLMETNLFKEVAVIVHSPGDQDAVLVAFCVMKNCLLDMDKIKPHMPHYMVPAYFIQLEQLPQNHNNKIDKNALKDYTAQYLKEQSCPLNMHAVSPEEEKLLAIWKEILPVASVSVGDDFFELGGNSLLVMKLISLIKKRYNLEVTIQSIFENSLFHKQVSLLASDLDKKRLPPISKHPQRLRYLATPQQKSIYIAHDLKHGNTDYNVPLLIELKGNVDIKRLENSLLRILQKHEALRTNFIWSDTDLYQEISAVAEYHLSCITGRTGSIFEIVNRLNVSFNLEKDLLFQAHVLQWKDSSYLFVNVHHIVCDGISLSILIKDLENFYNQNSSLEEETKGFQYKDYSEWFYQTLRPTELFQNSEKFWMNQLKTIPEPIQLQLPLPDERNGIKEDGNITYCINRDLSQWILSFIKNHKNTEFSFLLSVMYILVYKYTNATDIVFGVPIADRIDSALDDVVGMFVNTLPFRKSIDRDASYGSFLEDVQKLCVTVLEHQVYPLDLLMNEISSALQGTALFDILFVYQNMDIPLLQLDGISCRYIDDVTTSPKYCLVYKFYRDVNENLNIKVEYAKDRYSKASIQSFMRHYENVIREIKENMEIRIKDIEILSSKEREALNDMF